MLKKIFRAMIEGISFVLLLPFKVLVVLWVVYMIIRNKITGMFTVRESIGYVWQGFKEQLNKKIHWVKTGEIL